ncbi:MAG: signal peptidase II [Firmicutes bacterium]|nr:signal peptidase II [Bacillota bacterium]
MRVRGRGRIYRGRAGRGSATLVMVLVIIILTVICDQLSKMWVMKTFPAGVRVPVWDGKVYITRTANPGAAFGILPNQTAFLIVVAAVVLLLVIIYGRHLIARSPVLRLGFGLAVGGALGNMIDRLRFGRVTDFIDLKFWPVFNIADIAIVCGVVLLFWGLLRLTQ